MRGISSRDLPPKRASASPRISAEALALLNAFRWPGNVRQLENAAFRAVVLAEGDEIGVGEFPQIVAQVAGGGGSRLAGARSRIAGHGAHSHALAPSDSDMATAFDRVEIAPALRRRLTPASRCSMPAGEVRALEDVEADVIRFAIAHYRGQMSEVARRLRIGRSTLYRKLDALGGNAGKPAEDRVDFE